MCVGSEGSSRTGPPWALGGRVPPPSGRAALDSAPGLTQAGNAAARGPEGHVCGGREPPSPWNGVCETPRSSWGRAPRGQTSAKSRQNPSGGHQSGPKAQALCSQGAPTVIRRRGGVASCPCRGGGATEEASVPARCGPLGTETTAVHKGSEQRTIWGPLMQGGAP